MSALSYRRILPARDTSAAPRLARPLDPWTARVGPL